MDIYNSISSWVGWPPVVALLVIIGGIGLFLYQKHIELLRDEIEVLKRRLQDNQNYSPDVEAKKLADKQKVLLDRIESLSRDKAQNKQKITELEKELLATRDEASSMRTQLDSVQEILSDMNLPRDGHYNSIIFENIQKTVQEQNVIYIPIRLWGDTNDIASKKIEDGPYKIEIDFPGMNHMNLNVYDFSNNLIGQVENPYMGIYEKDYFVTLLEALKAVTSEHIPGGIRSPYSDVTFYKTSQFHSISPIDPSLFYIKMPMERKDRRGVTYG
jgi:uncharacterized coiled-coil protein SlyX